jgi:hypothetical protein
MMFGNVLLPARTPRDSSEGVSELWDIGPHSLVDNVHLRGFAANTRFSRMDQPAGPSTPQPSLDEPKKPAFAPSAFKKAGPVSIPSAAMQIGTPNAFAYFQNAHLRILGVPSHMVAPLKRAASLESALELRGLPELTRLWLEELSTSTDLEDVIKNNAEEIPPPPMGLGGAAPSSVTA